MAAPVALTGAANVTTATVASSATIAINKPAAVADHDLLVAVLCHRNSGATWTTIPTGWTQAASETVSGLMTVFYKYIPSAAAETPTSYTWVTSGGSGRAVGTIFRVTGADQAATIDAVGTAVTSGTSSIVDPSVTAVGASTLLLAVNSSTNSTTTIPGISSPPGMTQISNVPYNAGTATITLDVAAQTLTSAGATGTRTATVSPAGAAAAGFLLTIAPGGPIPGVTAPVVQTGTSNVTTATITSSAVIRVPKPANIANGDLLLATIVHRNSGALPSTIPPGWTAAPVAYTANGVLAAYWRYITNAAGEPAYYTWRASTGAARGAAAIMRITGAAAPSATHGPIDSYGTATGTGTSSIVDPATTAVAPASLLVACHATTATTTTAPAVSAPSGMTEVVEVPVVAGTSSASLEVATQALAAAGTTGTRTATVSPAAASVAGMLLTIAPPGYGIAQPAQLLARLTGGVSSSSARVMAATKFCSAVRFAVSTSASMTSPTFTASTAPDRDGIAMGTFTGLSGGTAYYWCPELDGALDTAHVSAFQTLPAAGTAASFSFVAASCAATDSNAASFADAAARRGPTGAPATFTVHLGDMHYQDIGTNDPAWVLGAWLAALQQSNQQALYAASSLAYTWSDHDFGGSNVSASAPTAPAVQAVYRKLFPSFALPGDGVGIYQSWQVGRVLFVMTDGRSYMSAIDAPDTSSKTKLGTAQRAWWKSQVTTPGVGLVIWLHEDGWNNASTFTGDDTWSAYTTERAELAAWITSHNVPLLYVHGDVHALSYDDGSHVPGRFPLISASPWDQTTFIGNGLLTGGFVPDPVSSTTRSQQYGWFDVIDSGEQIVVRYSGVSGGQVVQRQELSWGIDRRLGWGVPL